MAERDKNQPAVSLPPPALSERFARAIDDADERRPLEVRLKVRGGLPSKAYRFDFVARGDGSTETSLSDELRARREEGRKGKLEDREVRALFKAVQPALDMAVEQPRFLPDTVVGILEVSDGTSVRRLYFAADPEQARTQGLTLAPALAKAVDAIYAQGARLTGQRTIKP